MSMFLRGGLRKEADGVATNVLELVRKEIASAGIRFLEITRSRASLYWHAVNHLSDRVERLEEMAGMKMGSQIDTYEVDGQVCSKEAFDSALKDTKPHELKVHHRPFSDGGISRSGSFEWAVEQLVDGSVSMRRKKWAACRAVKCWGIGLYSQDEYRYCPEVQDILATDWEVVRLT